MTSVRVYAVRVRPVGPHPHGVGQRFINAKTPQPTSGRS